MNWQPISTAPDVGAIRLRNDRWSPPYLFYRRGNQWESTIFAPGGRVRVVWDRDLPQPTEWHPA